MRFGDYTRVELYEGCAYVTQRDDDVWRIFTDHDGLPCCERLVGAGLTELAELRARYAPPKS